MAIGLLRRTGLCDQVGFEGFESNKKGLQNLVMRVFQSLLGLCVFLGERGDIWEIEVFYSIALADVTHVCDCRCAHTHDPVCFRV